MTKMIELSSPYGRSFYVNVENIEAVCAFDYNVREGENMEDTLARYGHQFEVKTRVFCGTSGDRSPYKCTESPAEVVAKINEVA